MLNNLTQTHDYPGKLFVVEGIDGSGKSTQLGLLAKWLTAEGHRVFVTEWNSSALVKAATKTGKTVVRPCPCQHVRVDDRCPT